MMKYVGVGSVIFFLVVSVAIADVMARSDLSATDAARVTAVTQPTANFSQAEPFENRTAGEATSFSVADVNAFSQPQPNLTFSDREQFSLGNALFRKLWVSSPSTTLASDGLGPLFNARACQACHIKDGRGHLPDISRNSGSFVIRLGVKDHNTDEWLPDPVYGHQVQTAAVPGLLAEAQIQITKEEGLLTLEDGTAVLMNTPAYEFKNLAYKALHPDVRYSARVAPPMIGMGLLEAIADEDLIALEDPDDEDGDGISGRRAIIAMNGKTLTGRFGYKAASATVEQQVANAFSTDMGLSSEQKPNPAGDCTVTQTACIERPHGEQAHLGKGEVPENLIKLVTFYSSNLAPPARRNVDDKNVLAGKKLFYEVGCTGCHTPKFVTSRNATQEQHRFQLIWPYSDLLLHDMGEGLADELGDNSGASGAEWRTPPLWGIGLTQLINPRATYLHDGRAKTLLEAVLWHGGEARDARRAVQMMSDTDRSDLIEFLRSL